ncbi:FG-GAP repeat domain-containing protein [Streptomyces vilmorinianum]|uniref:FG-GAP repeat domain-containing protein n=1 Tax=Streptomyces vilmorinianum TaxID=3051092 RepID=UPI0010FB1A86|nr:VCBS repeat-containing protein [Streptomyces vilmorinianum]
MAKFSGLNTTGILSRVTVAAITAALVATTTSAVAADGPRSAAGSAEVQQSAPAAGAFSAEASSADAPVNALYGVDGSGFMYGYAPNGTGGLDSRQYVGSGWEYTKQITQVDHDADGSADGIWDVTNGSLYYTPYGADPILIGGGWGIYDKVHSTGNLAGAAADDLLARDNAGVLWLYLGYGNGKVTSRIKVGAGWGIYDQIAGNGDLNNDGKADIVARDTSGVLWLYKGTGSYSAPFQPRTKIGAGWGIYNKIVSVGDIDLDGITDLIARDKGGALWLYKGTAVAAAPYKPRVQIGTGGWNTYRLMF